MKRITYSILVVVPIVEIVMFVLMSNLIGGGNTFLLSLVLLCLGITVMRTQGAVSISRLFHHVQAGQQLSRETIDDALLLISGLLMAIPGLLSGAMGLCLLLPFLRGGIVRLLLKRKNLLYNIKHFHQDFQVIEGEYWEDEEK